MTNEITPSKHPIPALFAKLGIENVKPSDKFGIDYAEGFLTATINREGGRVEVVRKHLNGGFTEITSYDPNSMDKDQRNKVIAKLSGDGFSQSEIARRIGVTQSTISNVLRKPKPR